MSEISVIIRTADQTRKAEVKLSSESSGADVIDAAVSNWSLPTDTDYTLVNINGGSSVQTRASLKASGVKDGDVLEVQPVLVAG